MIDAATYTYRVDYSEKDGAYVAKCDEFPSLSYLDEDPDDALDGLQKTVERVLADMERTGETIPAPRSVR